MNRRTKPQELGLPAPSTHTGRWVQTDRRAHEAWANLISRKPRAAELMHHLVAQMGHQNAVVISQKLLAQLMGRSLDTVQRALRVLEDEKWIQTVKMNGPGTVAAYVVNDRVAWGQKRDELYLSTFSATVVADRSDQDALALQSDELRKIPMLYPGERQLPTGPGEEPPSQPSIHGIEPDLPALPLSEDERERRKLEQLGQQRLPE